MTIAVMFPSELNMAAAKAISKKTGDDIQDFDEIQAPTITNKRLILLELDAKGWFQRYTGLVDRFAQKLKEKKILDEIEYIDVVVSDVGPDNSLFVFTGNLCKVLNSYEDREEPLKEGAKEITVRGPCDMGDHLIFIIPPSESKSTKWEVYCFPYGTELQITNKSFKGYKEYITQQDMRPLWTGEDIRDWYQERPEGTWPYTPQTFGMPATISSEASPEEESSLSEQLLAKRQKINSESSSKEVITMKSNTPGTLFATKSQPTETITKKTTHEPLTEEAHQKTGSKSPR